MGTGWKGLSRGASLSKRLFALSIAGYSLFIAANTFNLREPSTLFGAFGSLSQIALRDLTYLPFALGSVGVGLIVLKRGDSSAGRGLLPISVALAAAGMLLYCLALLGVASGFAVPLSMVSLGLYGATMFGCWIRVVMYMTRGQVWLFVIATSVIAALLHFVVIQAGSLVPAPVLFASLSAGSLAVLALPAFRGLGGTERVNPCGPERSSALKALGRNAAVVVALGALGFVSSSSRTTFPPEMLADAATGGMWAVFFAGALLFVLIFAMNRDVDIRLTLLLCVPVLAAGCVVMPFAGVQLQLVFLVLSTTFFTVGLLMLQVLCLAYGGGEARVSVGAYCLLSGCVYAVTMLGYQLPLDVIAGELGTKPEIVSSLVCLAVLVVGLSADALVSPLREALPDSESDPVGAAVGRIASDYALTAKEADVLLLMASGRDIPSIARQLVVSQSTVRTHSKHIFKKMGVHSRQGCIDVVMRERA